MKVDIDNIFVVAIHPSTYSGDFYYDFSPEVAKLEAERAAEEVNNKYEKETGIALKEHQKSKVYTLEDYLYEVYDSGVEDERYSYSRN